MKYKNLKKYDIYSSKTTLFNSKINNIFKIGLIKIGRKKNSVFQIVVINYNNKKIDNIGFYNPKLCFSKSLVYSGFSNKIGKIISLDFKKVFFWLSKKIKLGPFFHKIVKIFFFGFLLIEYYRISVQQILIKNCNFFFKKDKINFFYNQISNFDK
jgi:ribosomal protein S16